MAESSFTFTGQVRPVCQLGMSDVRQPEPDEWVDISCYVHECELFRGRDRFTDRFQPGTATITFKNTTGWADLVGSPSVVATQTLRPGRPIRVGVTALWPTGTPGVRWLWRGWIDQCTPQYHPTEHDVVVVNCVDALGEAGSAPAPAGPFQGVNESVEVRVHRVLDAVEWFTPKRKIDASATLVQGTSLGTLGIDMMGQAADSAGGVVYGDLDGDVVFRDIDWMLYDPDDPPDGIIGNVDPGFPGIPYVPGYLNPDVGYVYWPDPPPMTSPTTLTVCASAGEGTLIEQGDGYELYVQDGRLYFRAGGRVWDMGPYDGGCTGVSIDSDGVPTRIDDPDGDGIYEDGEVGTEITDELPANVELLAWRDLGLADAAQGVASLGPITPGPDCWIIVLCNTVGSLSNVSPFGPTIDGGGVDWTLVQAADVDEEGAASFIWAGEIPRDNPGTGFSIVIDWAGEARSYAVTVWRARMVATDYRARLDAGSVLRAVTSSEGAGDTPGNGPVTIDLVDGTATAGSTVVEHTIIAQSLAEESTPPFGAVFTEETPPWVVPPLPAAPEVGLLTVGDLVFRDDFDRADGNLGFDSPWLTASGIPTGWPDTNPLFISGEAVYAVPTPRLSEGSVEEPTIVGDQAAEIEVIGFDASPVVYIGVKTRSDMFNADYTAVHGYLRNDGSDVTAGIAVFAGGTVVDDSVPFTGTVADPCHIRLESVGTTHTLYIDDDVVHTVDADAAGDMCGMFLDFDGGATPHIEWFEMGGAGPTLKASWVAGWRSGAVTGEVAWSDVNTGPIDVQSAQAAVVVETLGADSPATEGDLILGGGTNPYTGQIYGAKRLPGTDPNAPVDPVWIFAPVD